MKVEVFQAFLTIEGKRLRLTKAIAKQFPICAGTVRMVAAGQAKDPICKVRGAVLGRTFGWLYLVEDAVAGLVWEPACIYRGEYAERMREKGYNVDEPALVPMVIL